MLAPIACASGEETGPVAPPASASAAAPDESHSFFPLLADEARARGYELPLPYGAALVLTPNLPSGKLETAVTDVTVVAPPPTTETLPPETVEPPPEEDVDKRCWTMFGGGPRRELSRPAIDLGIPKGKPIWARGLKEYIEYPPSYCDGVLYVNTFRGDTWAIEAETGKVIWKKVSSAPKPSTPAIAGDKLIVSSKDGTVTALTRKSGKLVWQLRTNAKVESSPAVAGDTVYFGATDGRLFAVYPSRKYLSAKVRTFIDFVAADKRMR